MKMLRGEEQQPADQNVIQNLDTKINEDDEKPEENEDTPEPQVRWSSRIKKKKPNYMNKCQLLVNKQEEQKPERRA